MLLRRAPGFVAALILLPPTIELPLFDQRQATIARLEAAELAHTTGST